LVRQLALSAPAGDTTKAAIFRVRRILNTWTHGTVCVTFGTRIHGSKCLLTNWISCASSYATEKVVGECCPGSWSGSRRSRRSCVAGPKRLRRSGLWAALGNGPSGVEHNRRTGACAKQRIGYTASAAPWADDVKLSASITGRVGSRASAEAWTRRGANRALDSRTDPTRNSALAPGIRRGQKCRSCKSLRLPVHLDREKT
jgi:hypothetical protein